MEPAASSKKMELRSSVEWSPREANREAAEASRAAKVEAAGGGKEAKTTVGTSFAEAKKKAANARKATGSAATAAMSMPVITGEVSGGGEEECTFDPDGVPFDDYDDVALDGKGMKTHRVNFDHAGEHDFEPPSQTAEDMEMEIPDRMP